MQFDRRPVPTNPSSNPTYSTWDVATHGPNPRPDWVVTDLAAIDTDLGVLKTGKEADVHLRRRAPCPDGARDAARRQALPRRRAPDVPPRRRLHRGPPRAASSRETPRDGPPHRVRPRAARRASGPAPSSPRSTALWELGAPVPYPVQLYGTELLLEFIGDAGRRRPRRGWRRCRPAPRRARRPVRAVRRRDAAAGPRRLRARRPVAVQPARARRPAGA